MNLGHELLGLNVRAPRGLKKRRFIEGREIKPSRDPEKRRAYARKYQREWAKRNKDKVAAIRRKYRKSDKGRETYRKHKLRHYARHADRLKAIARAYWHNVRKFRDAR